MTAILSMIWVDGFGQSISNMVVQGTFRSSRSTSGANSSAGVWGWMGSNGKEYALLSSRNAGGVSVVDITTTPATPTEVSFVPANVNSVWHELNSSGNYVYKISQEGNTGLQIIDLSPLNTGGQARLVKSMAIYGGNLVGHTVFCDTTTNPRRLYITYGGAEGVAMYSLANPETPVLIGLIAGETHDIFARGNRLYCSTQRRGTVEIWNVTTPQNPMPTSARLGVIDLRAQSRLNGEISQTSNTIAHNAWSTADDKFLFTTEEIRGAYVKSWDVSNPATPRYLGRWIGVTDIIAHNGFVNGRYMYIGHYTAGLYQVDIMDPRNMKTVGNHTPRTPAPTNLYGGTWGVYGWYPTRRLFHGDDVNGLYILVPSPSIADPTGVPNIPTAIKDDVTRYSLTITNLNRNEIRFQLPGSGAYALSIFNPAGEKVFNVRKQGAGLQSLPLGKNLAVGSYTAKLEQNEKVLTSVIALRK